MSEDTAEAFAAFAASMTVSDLQDLARFTKVVPSTVLSWVEKNELPKGEQLFRLQHYLEARGFKVDELRTLPRPAYKLAQLFAFDVITTEDARVLLEYTNMSDLYRVLRGASPMAERGTTLQQLISTHEKELAEAIAAFKERHHAVRPQSLQSAHLSPEILSSTLMGGVDLLDNILGIVDLQFEESDENSLVPLSDQFRISRLIERLQRYI